jgi:hypothetical protein
MACVRSGDMTVCFCRFGGGDPSSPSRAAGERSRRRGGGGGGDRDRDASS